MAQFVNTVHLHIDVDATIEPFGIAHFFFSAGLPPRRASLGHEILYLALISQHMQIYLARKRYKDGQRKWVHGKPAV